MAEQFYQLTLQEAVADYKAGLITATGLLKYYIKIRFAPGWRIVLDPKEVCKLLAIAKVTFYKAIAKLKQLGWNFGRNVQIIGEDSDPVVEKEDPSGNNSDLTVDSSDPTVDKSIRSYNFGAKNPSITRRPSDSPNTSTDNNQIKISPSNREKPKKKPSKEAYREFWASLSKDEREKFLDFVREKTKHFKNPIASIHDYLKSENRWEEFARHFRLVTQYEESKTRDWTQHPDWENALKVMKVGIPTFRVCGEARGIDCKHISRDERIAMISFALAKGFIKRA